MKAFIPVVLALLLTSGLVQTTRAQGAPVREVLSNDSIINLAKAGFKENTIIALIRTSPVSFDITTAKLVTLKKNNVSEKIITAMIERQTLGGGLGGGSLADDEFFKQDDDAFFRGANPNSSNNPGQKEAPPQINPRGDSRMDESENPIFGSRSGGKSQSRSRGLGGPNGSASNEGETLGSASVRIIRPPSENGGPSAPKLERAPKLDNKAILDLIEAGFSEGSILRKIESSQVDFDVSTKALAELRKNRVSESVIKAMAEAMGIEMK
ncbi:MAG: hypothetical protein HYR56_30455 [Acidobacteria bacterium]|nr:hypothetical protein [Acidobacteriota bacterium]MBI3422944.1 hypothetical protein [Acidobacteriota bacterium]